MEHEWGRNVVKFGLGDLGAAMAGIHHGFTPPYYVIHTPVGPFYRVTQYVPTNTSPTYVYFAIPKPHAHPHFPYGEVVDPDAPL